MVDDAGDSRARAPRVRRQFLLRVSYSSSSSRSLWKSRGRPRPGVRSSASIVHPYDFRILSARLERSARVSVEVYRRAEESRGGLSGGSRRATAEPAPELSAVVRSGEPVLATPGLLHSAHRLPGVSDFASAGPNGSPRKSTKIHIPRRTSLVQPQNPSDSFGSRAVDRDCVSIYRFVAVSFVYLLLIFFFFCFFEDWGNSILIFKLYF